MGELQYVQRTYSPLSHGLMSAASLSEAPRMPRAGSTTAAFPSEYHPSYPSVTFTKPPTAASNLLTPTSSSMASPPMHPNQLHHDPHYGSSYQQPGTPHTQRGTTPPPHPELYYQNAIDYNSQTSSPMPNQGVLPPEVMSRPYDMDERRSAPSPPEFQHFGSYGVSGGHSASDTPSSYYYHNPVVRHEPNAYPLGLHPEGSRPLVSLPLLGQPQATQSRQPRQRGEEMMVLPDNVAAPKAPSRDTPSKRAAQPSRVRKRPARKGSSGSRAFGVEAASAADHLDCHGEERQPLLSPDTPDEERLIMDLRWRYRNSKGQDMWDSIQREYHRAFQKDCPKEQLQMKYKRARARYFQWQERDIHLLVEAYLEVERSRYSAILEKFLERGGSRNMQLSASDIEAKLVNGLKLEEGLYIDHPAKSDHKVRRRRKLSARARQGKPGDNSAEVLREETSLPGLRQATDPDETLHQIQERDAQAANGSWPGASGLSPGMTSCHVQNIGQAAVPLQHGERADFPGKSNKRATPRRST